MNKNKFKIHLNCMMFIKCEQGELVTVCQQSFLFKTMREHNGKQSLNKIPSYEGRD